jgi:hypothetical protein
VGSTIRADLEPVTGLADDLAGKLMGDMLGEASLEIKKQALHIGELITGGDLRLSRFGTKKSRGGRKLGVGYEVSGNQATVTMKPAGLWVLLTDGAGPHMIGAGRRAKSGRVTNQKGRPVLKFGGRFATAPIKHPGSRGKAGLDRVHAQVPRIVDETFHDVLAEAVP